ncbi:hypothetical protein QR680_000946 [Steinernema hermaphroditum]|uniref:Uncharacterized protein n=1 Tax=Steinernema hermaphroditum TaxID=289476 RepID=A0AA39GWF7_9BILA|nr:hypothetical protein QR680_000946 [Steinernema hermaphroditum]
MNNYVVLNSSEQQKLQIQKSEVEAYDFEPCEVYAASIFMSTGDDKAHTGFTTMYRRLEDAVCNVKMKTLRIFLLVCTEDNQAYVAHFKSTVAIQPSGLLKTLDTDVEIKKS